jgi:hypothetical protein
MPSPSKSPETTASTSSPSGSGTPSPSLSPETTASTSSPSGSGTPGSSESLTRSTSSLGIEPESSPRSTVSSAPTTIKTPAKTQAKASSTKQPAKTAPESFELDFMGRKFYFEKDNSNEDKVLLEKNTGAIKDKHAKILQLFKDLHNLSPQTAPSAPPSTKSSQSARSSKRNEDFLTDTILYYYKPFVETFVKMYTLNENEKTITDFNLKLHPILIDDEVKNICRGGYGMRKKQHEKAKTDSEKAKTDLEKATTENPENVIEIQMLEFAEKKAKAVEEYLNKLVSEQIEMHTGGFVIR